MNETLVLEPQEGAEAGVQAAPARRQGQEAQPLARAGADPRSPPTVAALGTRHESIDAATGERIRGALHIRTVNSRHSRIEDFLHDFRGIATESLDSDLRCFHLIELGDRPSPKACLEAAMARQCLTLCELSHSFLASA